MDAFDFASSSQVPCGKYDVFISFRGSDVRYGFLSHLKKELRQKSIDVYVDDRLERGEEISSALVNAIEGSMIALVIFSKDYASSKWCLQELVKIMELKEANQNIVIPIFYYVDPSHVRHQKCTYADAFTLHEQNFKDNKDNLQIWRSVLKKAAELSGYHSSNFQEESKLIDAIVKDVLKKLEENNPIVLKSQLVGFHQNFISVESLMEIKSQEVRILGIWGMGGIGKTTLSRAVFDKFLPKFESCCFVENVKAESTRINGLSHLHQKLLSELLDQEDLRINKNVAMRRLQRKKVLIVLDDVDDPKQLKYLAGQQLYLGPGSRVIVTSRDKHVLTSGGIQVKYIHEVKGLNFEESLELFSLHAFNRSYPNMGYEQLSIMTVAIAEGIPLALEVLGSHFNSRDKAYWESELTKLQKYPHKEIQNILKISYDGLDDMDKEVFLDIAFFFLGKRKDTIIGVLEACGFKAVSGIENLLDKALIKSNEDDNIVMHDLIREMAEQIVREECTKHPERRSRLKDADEIYQILKNNMGTDEIEGIILDVSRIKYLQLSANIFKRLKNLRILNFFAWSNDMAHIELPSGVDSFPEKLRYFCWDYFPLESLPPGSYVENLVELHMVNSNAKKLWDGVQYLANLKTINLRGSKQLIELPDLSMAHKLETIYLNGCRRLSSIHPSILSLHTIVEMDVSECLKLESLESETHLESLSVLRAHNCRSLKKLCVSSKKLGAIIIFQNEVAISHLSIGRSTQCRKLTLNGERLRSLPINELCCLTNLEEFIVWDFKQVIHTMELHSLLDAWRNISDLRLEGWSYLLEIPDNIKGLTRLTYLSLKNSSVETLPACISHLSSLTHISLSHCRRLKFILGLPPFLEKLDATCCTSLETVSSNDSRLRNQCIFYFLNCAYLDECSLQFIEELTHVSMTAFDFGEYQCYVGSCYPGSKVPKWLESKQMTEASNAVEFTCNLEWSHRVLFCCVVPDHLVSNYRGFKYGICCDFSIDDDDKFYTTYYDEIYNYHQLNSEHVFLWCWYEGILYERVARTGNHAKISCEFFVTHWDHSFKVISKVPVKACGVHLIYNSGSELEEEEGEEEEWSESELV